MKQLRFIWHCNYAYDAYFLECSQAFNSPLLTLDIRLKKVATKLGIKLL
jgi:predicted nucleic acid-binding protein